MCCTINELFQMTGYSFTTANSIEKILITIIIIAIIIIIHYGEKGEQFSSNFICGNKEFYL